MLIKRRHLFVTLVFFLTVSLISTPMHATNTLEVSNQVHLILNVPYVSQETEFFCAYASCTMILQYLQRNTTLPEVLYYTGVGYSQAHQDTIPLVSGGYTLSQFPEDLQFMATQYGLTSTVWYPNSSISSDATKWELYWTYLTQNITEGKPILTSVDPFRLPSLQNQFNLPDAVWEYLPAGGHAIVVIGFNESNNTICYNDPAADVFGTKQSYGYYAWMDRDSFHDAITTTQGTHYMLLSFTNTSSPLPQSEAFRNAHDRNLQRLQGNQTAYDEAIRTISGLSLGIRAVEALQQDLSGVRQRIQTILLFKLFGMYTKKYNRQLFLTLLREKTPISPNIILFSTEHGFDRIAMEKQYTATYLQYVENQGIDVGDERTLFTQETEFWTSFASYYTKFINRGFFMSTPLALYYTKQMHNLLEEIISVEETILNN